MDRALGNPLGNPLGLPRRLDTPAEKPLIETLFKRSYPFALISDSQLEVRHRSGVDCMALSRSSSAFVSYDGTSIFSSQGSGYTTRLLKCFVEGEPEIIDPQYINTRFLTSDLLNFSGTSSTYGYCRVSTSGLVLGKPSSSANYTLYQIDGHTKNHAVKHPSIPNDSNFQLGSFIDPEKPGVHSGSTLVQMLTSSYAIHSVADTYVPVILNDPNLRPMGANDVIWNDKNYMISIRFSGSLKYTVTLTLFRKIYRNDGWSYDLEVVYAYQIGGDVYPLSYQIVSGAGENIAVARITKKGIYLLTCNSNPGRSSFILLPHLVKNSELSLDDYHD